MDSVSQGLAAAAGSLLLVSAVLSLAKGALSNLNVAQALDQTPAEGRERLRRLLGDVEARLGAARLADFVVDCTAIVCLLLVWIREQPDTTVTTLALVALVGGLALLVLGEGLPAAMGRHSPEPVVRRLAPLLRWPLALFVLPARWLGYAAVRLAPRRDGPEVAEGTDGEPLDEEIRSAVSAGEREMIEGIIELRGQRLHEVMTPRTDMATIAAASSLADAVRFADECGHSRIPVHGENRDEIVGILYVKDLLKLWDAADRSERTLGELMRKPFFVPETTLVGEALREMRGRKVHMAIAVDEYGGTAGLVTIEDILEEIVGEIQDEYDDEEEIEEVRKLDERTVEMPARTRLDEVEAVLGVELPDNGTYETVGGFLIASIGKIPAKGDRYAVNGYDFTVLDADERRIKRLRLHVREAHGAPPA